MDTPPLLAIRWVLAFRSRRRCSRKQVSSANRLMLFLQWTRLEKLPVAIFPLSPMSHVALPCRCVVGACLVLVCDAEILRTPEYVFFVRRVASGPPRVRASVPAY